MGNGSLVSNKQQVIPFHPVKGMFLAVFFLLSATSQLMAALSENIASAHTRLRHGQL